MRRRLQRLHCADFPVVQGKLANQQGALVRMQPVHPKSPGQHSGCCKSWFYTGSAVCFSGQACFMTCLTSLCSTSICLALLLPATLSYLEEELLRIHVA